MRRHVDTCSRNGYGRTTSEMIKRSSFLCESLGNFDDALAFESKIAGITDNEVASVGSTGCDVGICGRESALGWSC